MVVFTASHYFDDKLHYEVSCTECLASVGTLEAAEILYCLVKVGLILCETCEDRTCTRCRVIQDSQADLAQLFDEKICEACDLEIRIKYHSKSMRSLEKHIQKIVDQAAGSSACLSIHKSDSDEIAEGPKTLSDETQKPSNGQTENMILAFCDVCGKPEVFLVNGKCDDCGNLKIEAEDYETS